MIKTVSDLRRFLEDTHQSPEELARKAKISNMTIRRLLERPNATPIPEKYAPMLAALELSRFSTELDGQQDFRSILNQLEADGSGRVSSVQVKADLKKKLKLNSLTTEFREMVSRVLSFATSKETQPGLRSLCFGALLYFINPVDLIPDALGPVGFLDDFAILSLVVSSVTRGRGRA